MKTYDDIGVQIPKVFLPKEGVDLTRWAVIACDQFTSQPDYWQRVEQLVGGSPSTLKLIFPEIYLDKPGEAGRIQSIQMTMCEYLAKGILRPRAGLVYVERSVGGKTRKGILLCLDLERYDYSQGAASLIRATEGTIIERLPPRMKIRTGAALELPHILVLVDDPQGTVIEPVAAAKDELEKLYDFELMLGSGHLTGYAVSEAVEEKIVAALRGLARPETFAARYGISVNQPVLLFAMGDGNHSLATAKAVWEEMKPQVGMDHPARYALVEIENVHDEGLTFEPIHRLLFGLKRDIFAALKSHFGADFTYTPIAGAEEMVEAVDNAKGPLRHGSPVPACPGGQARAALAQAGQAIGLVSGGKRFGVVEIANPSSNLPVGTLQAFLDDFMKENGAEKIDYVHGQEVVCSLGAQKGNAGFYVPGMGKSDLFKTVLLDGVLPRKTFSIGAAHEKRFYMEARKIA